MGLALVVWSGKEPPLNRYYSIPNKEGKSRKKLLDTWNISYSSFHNWRVWLCSLLEFNLNEMEGFTETPNEAKMKLLKMSKDFDEYYMKSRMAAPKGKSWLQSQRFYEILNHSDCDGFLTYDQCVELWKDFQWFEKSIESTISEDNKGRCYNNHLLIKKTIKFAVENEAHIRFS